MTFPQDYPMSPPTLEVLSDFWFVHAFTSFSFSDLFVSFSDFLIFRHPNVYKGGKVCISILHPPGNDPMSGELPEERWLPTQTVSTIMLSFQSMLSDPNINSPANLGMCLFTKNMHVFNALNANFSLDASVQYRDRRPEFLAKAKTLADKAKKRAPAHVKIPHPDTDPEERGALQSILYLTAT